MPCSLCNLPGHYKTTCPKRNAPGYKDVNKLTATTRKHGRAGKLTKAKNTKRARTSPAKQPSVVVSVICPPVVFANKTMTADDEGRARAMLGSCAAPADIKAVQVHAKTAARADHDDVLYSQYLFDDQHDMGAHADLNIDNANNDCDIPLAILLSRLARTQVASTSSNLGKFPKSSEPGYVMRADWGNSGTYQPPAAGMSQGQRPALASYLSRPTKTHVFIDKNMVSHVFLFFLFCLFWLSLMQTRCATMRSTRLACSTTPPCR